ncbi:hypothetical protein A6M21_08065 [Desulfotomaculum copahuensis]|uniref:Uncharacterized protein n=1 Tax=Desulfotomaculum copahuensis TaxID=1838280 RepID=A0A1B7LFZ3_9FIRM|nr:hypothetical protein A6M21_08065 [Desulfotomaculum copahuensis]
MPVGPVRDNDSVHVWPFRLDRPALFVDKLKHFLSPDELARAGRIYFERDRRRFIVSRGLLRVLLGRYLDTAPDRLRFGYGACRKPALAEMPGGCALHFNLSRTRGMVVYAVTRRGEIGVDLEYVRPVSGAARIAGRYFAGAEKKRMQMLPEDKRKEAFFRLWTCLEAYLKATGAGLSCLPGRFGISRAPGEAARPLVYIDGKATEAAGWFLYEFSPATGYIAAVCAAGSGSAGGAPLIMPLL